MRPATKAAEAYIRNVSRSDTRPTARLANGCIVATVYRASRSDYNAFVYFDKVTATETRDSGYYVSVLDGCMLVGIRGDLEVWGDAYGFDVQALADAALGR